MTPRSALLSWPLLLAQVLAASLLVGAAAAVLAWLLLVGANVASALAHDGQTRLAGLWDLHPLAGRAGMVVGALLAVWRLRRSPPAEAAPPRPGALLLAAGAGLVAGGFVLLTLADARRSGLDFELLHALALASAGVTGLGAWAALTGAPASPPPP